MTNLPAQTVLRPNSTNDFGRKLEMMFYKVLIVPSIKANYQYVKSKGLESQLILVMDNINAPVIASHLNQRGKKRMNLIIL